MDGYYQSLSYTNWATGQPGNTPAEQDCMAMQSADGLWDDVNCHAQQSSLCEIERKLVCTLKLPGIRQVRFWMCSLIQHPDLFRYAC